jgi:hypothetical protein
MRPNAYRDHFTPAAGGRIDGARLLAGCRRSVELRAQEWTASEVGLLAQRTLGQIERYLAFLDR